MSALYFAVTGIQYWGFKYFAIVFPSTSVNTSTNLWFILCAITAPTMGIFFGGYITDKYGGYHGRSEWIVVLKLSVFAGSVACLASIPITLLSDFFFALSSLWILLFFGASILPASSGILINIVPKDFRPISSSLSLVVFNSFGYCLSLVLSGWFMQYLANTKYPCGDSCIMTWGFRLILLSSFVSLLFLILALRSAMKMQQDAESRQTSEKLFHSPIDFARKSMAHYGAI